MPRLGRHNKLLSISMPPQKNGIIGCPRFFPQSSIPSKCLLTDWGWHLLRSNVWHSFTNSSLLVYNSYLLSGRIYQSSIPSERLLTDWVTYYQYLPLNDTKQIIISSWSLSVSFHTALVWHDFLEWWLCHPQLLSYPSVCLIGSFEQIIRKISPSDIICVFDSDEFTTKFNHTSSS